jgi:predicted Zn-dependent peptidase
MNRTILKMILISFVAVFLNSQNLSAATLDAAKVLKKLEDKESTSVSLPKMKKGKTKRGFKYYILPDHELPVIKATILIRGGTVFDPPTKSGLTSITTTLMRSGGTVDMGPDRVDKYLDSIASRISISASKESIVAVIGCRSENFEESLQLLLDMLFRPRFDKDRFNLIKKRFINSVKRRADSPEGLASVGFRELLYGRANPWGVYPTGQTIESVNLDDVKDYHNNFFHPEEMILGVSGDLQPSKIIKQIKSYKYFPKARDAKITVPAADPKPVKGVHIIEKDTTQVVLNLGHAGSFRTNPDKYPLIVMNDILGGPGHFKRRLPKLIRVERGLAYSVWSHYGFGPRDANGLFKVYLATKTKSAVQAMELVISELQQFATEGLISEAEVKSAKEAILKKLIFEYSSAFGIISSVVKFNYLGYPDDYIEEYGKKIGEVKLDDVKRVARKYLHPDNLQVVMVGDGDEIRNNLKQNVKSTILTIDN